VLVDAEAIAVIPSVIKAGFGVGGRRGRGVIAVRGSDRTWSNPSYITLTGGSFGFQAGVQSTDVILVFRTRRGVDNIVGGKFTLGADASVAGRPGRAQRPGQHRRAPEGGDPELFARARGLFAGVALDGTRLAIDNKSNGRVYGAGHTAREIFEGRAGSGSEATIAFRDKLEESTVPQKGALSARAVELRGIRRGIRRSWTWVSAGGNCHRPGDRAGGVRHEEAAQRRQRPWRGGQGIQEGHARRRRAAQGRRRAARRDPEGLSRARRGAGLKHVRRRLQ
jgi:lipid-binding SYLF domain-containing protein